MIILDENILEDQRQLLLKWNVLVRQIGNEAGRKGMKDDEIIPFLQSLRYPTFFTLDADFFRRDWRQARYGLFCLSVKDTEAAFFIRRVLRHPRFDTQAKRMSHVIRVFTTGHFSALSQTCWESDTLDSRNTPTGASPIETD